MSEHKTLEEMLKARVAQVSDVNRSKDQFLATLSHELRTPLNAILGYIQMLRQGAVQAAGVDRALEIIERNAQTQHRLILDLLNSAQIVSGTLRLQPEAVELAPLVAESIDTIRPAARAKSIVLHAQPQPSGTIHGDPPRLRQIFTNILSNAVKFTPKRGRVDVNVATQGSSALVTVRDTGAGIEPGFQGRIFERFSQQQPSPGGVGLGLSIVRHLVELHGGTMNAASGGQGPAARSRWPSRFWASSRTAAGCRRGPGPRRHASRGFGFSSLTMTRTRAVW